MIRVIKDDITKVTDFDAIVNCANNSLLGGGGIDGLIHRAAGPQLRTECRRLNGCETGDSRLTYGYNLPCDYIIHSVGPVWMGGTAGERELLRSCYTSALTIAAENKIRKLAFCSLSTGELGYPVERAAKVAVAAVNDFIKKNPDAFDDICWVVTDDLYLNAYSEEIKAAAPKKKPVKKSKAADTEEKTEEVIEETVEKAEEAPSTDDNSSDDVKSTEEPADLEEITDDAAAEDASSDETAADEALNESEAGVDGDTETDSDTGVDSAARTASDTFESLDGLKLWNRYDINWLISEVEQGKQHKYTCFWHDTASSDNSILSSWHAGKPIMINGRKYVTAEQYMISEQALLFGDYDSYKIIMDEADPQKCKKAGRSIQNYDENTWRAAFKEIIFRGFYMRALCDEEFAKALLATGEDVLIEASPFDDVYGAGMKESELVTPEGELKTLPQEWRAYKSEKQSENVLGFVLMGVRDCIRKLQE
nr:macro domain-containing protein [Butyrivibrio sp. WCD3002]